MNSTDDKWKSVDAVIRLEKKGSQEVVADSLANPVQNIVKEPDGIIMQFKAQKIQRKAAIDLMKIWYSSQLEVAEHQLKTAVQLKKKSTETDAAKFLMDINARHIQYLIELGITNVKQRMEALETLQEQTAKMYEKITIKDWPKEMIDQTINAISKLNSRFFDKIMEEHDIEFKDK